MHTPTLPSLPHLPLRGGEVVRLEGGVYALLLEPLADEPGAFKSVPLKETLDPVPVDLLVHEELIEEVIGKASPSLLQKAQGMKKSPVWAMRDETLMAVQWGSENCLTEPWQKVVVCKKATILITERADINALKFSRFGEASLRELPDGRVEIVLSAGAIYFTGGYDALPDGGIVKKGASVKVFIEGKEVLLKEDEDLVLYVREGEDLPEVSAVF
jgi:hypothetical protein